MDMKKYILAIILAIVILIGFNQYLDDGIGTDSVTPIAGQTYTLAGSGISSSDTSITLTSFTITQTGYEILDSDMSETFYLTIEPGSRSRQEIVSCTTVTQNSDDTATLSGCERGLQPFSPYASSTDYAFAHSGGSTVIFSNPPQLYNQAAFKDNDAIITGSWLFPTPLSNDSAATKGYVDSVVSGTTTLSNDRLIVAGTAGETLATGTLVYFKGTDQEWYKVDTDDSTTYQDKFIGLTQGSGVNAGFINGGVLLKGRDVTQTGLTAGSTYYANTTAGSISAVVSAQPIGTAEDTNILYFDPVMIGVARVGMNNTFTGSNTFTGTSTFNGFVTGATRIETVTFTSSSTWTKDTGLQYIRVQAWGAGGSGGRTNVAGEEVGGGGGGGYSEAWFLASSLSSTESVVIGEGGLARSTNTAGDAGENSTFGSLVTAYGGGGGGYGSTGAGGGGGGGPISAGSSASGVTAGAAGSPAGSTAGAGGAGNSTPGSGSVGTAALYGGGGGGNARSGGASYYGGGGGSGADSSLAESGGTSVFGGAGGAGSIAASGNATSGTTPSGGGGAKWSNAGSGNSGAGGNGLIIVTEFY